MRKRPQQKPEVFTTTISSQGQIVLPAPVRSRLGLRKGMRINISLTGGEEGPIILQPVTGEFINRLCGSFKGAGAALEFLRQERKRERERGR
jgi:AbrB family looped-hinge helix DNA binding protein